VAEHQRVAFIVHGLQRAGAQLAEVLRVCLGSRGLSEAGRALDRLRKYLARFGLSRQVIQDRR